MRANAHCNARLTSPALPLLLFWGGVQQGFDAFAHDPVDYARSVESPTLLISGADDPLVTADETRAIFERLPGPKSLTLCSGVRHGSCLRTGGDQWQRSVNEFLSRHVPKPS